MGRSTAAAAFLLGLTACASAPTAPPSAGAHPSLGSTARLASRSPTATESDPLPATLELLVAVESGPELCGIRDPLLDRVAERIVARRATGAEPPRAAELNAMLRTAGSAHLWPAAWAVGPVAEPSVAQDRLMRWAAGRRTDGAARCGVALWRESAERWYAAAVRVDAMALLTKLPATVRRHGWVELEAEALAPLDSVHVVLLGPRGRPRRVLASSDGRILRSRFTLDQPGRWLVQLVGWGPAGPVPLLESSVAVDRSDGAEGDAAAVPGHANPSVAAACAPSGNDPPGAVSAPSGNDPPGAVSAPSGNDPPVAVGAPPPPRGPTSPTQCVQAVVEMLNAARRTEGARSLVSDPELERLASDHAARMARAQRLGHDVGDGTPAERIQGAGIQAATVGENAASAASAQDAHRVLWSSPSHRENMLDERYHRVGVGLAFDDRGTLWVAQLFTD